MMIKPDIITTNSYSLDFPYWRWLMETNKDKFGLIFNVFCDDHRKLNFRDFIMANTPWAQSIDIANIFQGDWRNNTVNAGLRKSNSNWVLFLEQDFIPEQDDFFDKVFTEVENYDVAGFVDNGEDWVVGKRLHPAFLIVRTALLRKTRLDFAAHPDKDRDHFGTFTDELLKFTPLFLDIRKYKWKHIAGVSSNYMLVAEGKKPNYKLDEFKDFVMMSMGAPVIQDQRFLELSSKCIESVNNILDKGGE